MIRKAKAKAEIGKKLKCVTSFSISISSSAERVLRKNDFYCFESKSKTLPCPIFSLSFFEAFVWIKQ
jgi:hypothetical protein